MQLPRPYDNRWLLQGTRGIYNEQRNAVYLADRSPAYHQWEPFPPYEAQYKHKLWEKGGAGGHGGVDGLMLRSFLEAVREKRPLPIDVYDSVTMSAIIGLSGQSIASGSQPVEFPDFTRGKWEAAKAKFALDQREFPAPSALTRTEDGMVAQTFALGLRPLAVELADVEVRITGEPKPYAGWAGIGNEPSHCLFAEEEWGIEIAVPKGAKGVVAVYAYAQDGLRRQSVTFEDRKPDELDDLTKGRWLEYPFTAGESADGVLRVRIRKLEGANCVLSRLKITIPDKGT